MRDPGVSGTGICVPVEANLIEFYPRWIVFLRYTAARLFFVHGCSWHGHDCSRGGRTPQSDWFLWTQKVAGDKARDQRNVEKLTQAGWQLAIVWECHLRDEKQVTKALPEFLGPRCADVLTPVVSKSTKTNGLSILSCFASDILTYHIRVLSPNSCQGNG